MTTYRIQRDHPPYDRHYSLWQWRRSTHGGSWRRLGGVESIDRLTITYMITYRSRAGQVCRAWPEVATCDLEGAPEGYRRGAEPGKTTNGGEP